MILERGMDGWFYTVEWMDDSTAWNGSMIV
jgi:hypothetical protein